MVVALSYSGETQEILRLLETIRRLGATLIAITGQPGSTLAEAHARASQVEERLRRARPDVADVIVHTEP